AAAVLAKAEQCLLQTCVSDFGPPPPSDPADEPVCHCRIEPLASRQLSERGAGGLGFDDPVQRPRPAAQGLHGRQSFALHRSSERSSSRIPASISPTKPKPNRTTPEITSTMMRSRRGRNPTCGGPNRRYSATPPTSKPSENNIAPMIPKNSIGLRPKRSWNHTDMRSRTPTGMRLIPNLE